MKAPIYFISGILLLAACQKPSKDITATQVPGTPVSVPLPEGFYADPTITGFRHNVYTDATILVVSVPLRYDQAIPQLDKMEAVGQKLFSKEPVTVDGIQGLLCDIRLIIDGYNYRQWRLVLPESENTITVSATFPVDQEKDISIPMKKALLAVKLSDKPDTGALAFDVQPTQELKVAKIFEGPSIMYTADGIWNNSSIFAYSFLCGSNASGAYMDSQSQADYAFQSFQQICPTCAIDGQDSLQVDGLKGIEIWGVRKDSRITRLKYEALLFDSLKCYYMIGTTDKDNPSRLEAFKSSVRTWRRKDKPSV